ncbi:hypothetical protein ACWDNR_26760, partial [Gordonia aichiensis]
MRSSVLSLTSARDGYSATPPLDRAVASALPTRLRPADLLRLTDEGAEDVLAGRYDHLLPADGVWPTEERWATRLIADDEVDVWPHTCAAQDGEDGLNPEFCPLIIDERDYFLCWR